MAAQHSALEHALIMPQAIACFGHPLRSTNYIAASAGARPALVRTRAVKDCVYTWLYGGLSINTAAHHGAGGTAAAQHEALNACGAALVPR